MQYEEILEKDFIKTKRVKNILKNGYKNVFDKAICPNCKNDMKWVCPDDDPSGYFCPKCKLKITHDFGEHYIMEVSDDFEPEEDNEEVGNKI